MNKIIGKKLRDIDVKGWIALAWAVGFGLLYAEMVLRSRAPGLLAALRGLISR